jgi:outer membrane protein assembly factor BamB
MMRRGGGSRFAVLLGLVVVLGVAGAGAPARAADKPPAFKPSWSVEAKYELERITVGAGGTVVYARDGKKLTGLNTADGSKKWQMELPGFEEKGYWGPVDSTTYVYSTSKELVGIDIEAGTERWRASPGDGIKPDFFLYPKMGHPNALMIAFSDGTGVWDIARGKLLWHAKERPSEDMSPSVWARGEDPATGVLVFLSKRTVFIDTTGKEAWSAPEPGNERRGGRDVLKSAIIDYGRLLVVYLAKQVVILNNVTGEVIASQAFPSDEAAADVEVFQLGMTIPCS